MASLQRGLKSIVKKNANDVVILSAIRTPVTRAYKGGLNGVYPEQMLASVLQATKERIPEMDPAVIEDVTIGTVLSELGGSKAARSALNHVGYPVSTAIYTVNRACASGLQAVANVADAIAVGRIDAGIGGGMESMSMNYGTKALPNGLWDALRTSHSDDARNSLVSMGLTSENVAERYGISRQDQDWFACRSHERASKAQIDGRFKNELVPVQTTALTIDSDDGIRHNSSVESLARLKPAFKDDGASTAGNSSQISDGAAAALLMRRSTAQALGLEKYVLGKFAGSWVAGVPPDEMGIGPAISTPKLLSACGITVDDVDIWELNEAFASQALYCVRKLGLDMAKVNPNGGAIALGHPLGATGARQLATLLHEMQRAGKELGVVTMCVGTGMGQSALVVAE